MKIAAHRYILEPGPDKARAAKSPREGALVRVEFRGGLTGYANIHPWPEFGHAPLDQQLASLGKDHAQPAARLALEHARADAVARRAGVSLFEGLPAVRSHALFTGGADTRALEACAKQGYAAAKLKIGPETDARALGAHGKTELRLRLDANARFSPASLADWLGELSPDARAGIEFLEDPCPYHPAAWADISARTGLELAADWEAPPVPPPWPGAGIAVIKPASQDAFSLALAAVHAGMEIVVTHSMDHPLGRAVALWAAMSLRQRHGDLVRDGGLQGAGLYEADAFSEALIERGPETTPPSGTGFGFDDILEGLKWEPL